MSSEELASSRKRSVFFLIIAFVLVLLALYIATQVVSVLFGIIMPPSPPLPNGVSETSHESSDYGVDSWAYSTEADTCDVLAFYEANGGTCFVAPGQCGREGTEQISLPVIGQCVGNVPFSIFNMQWRVELFHSGRSGTHIELDREVFWIGTGPTTTPQFNLDQLSPSPNATSEG